MSSVLPAVTALSLGGLLILPRGEGDTVESTETGCRGRYVTAE